MFKAVLKQDLINHRMYTCTNICTWAIKNGLCSEIVFVCVVVVVVVFIRIIKAVDYK